jgi:DNA-binding LacI/PurR family transcriptional regulator
MVPPSNSASKARQPQYRRIADGLRTQIMSGELVPGQQLPSKGELMGTWKSSSFTIHTAVQTLIKEGWVESIRGAGTYVAHFENRFNCAGIYHGINIFADEGASFSRVLHTSLLEQLHALGKDTLVFVDSRPENKQGTILPQLEEAILHRRIQCLIAPTLNSIDFGSLARISLPTAYGASTASSHQVNFDLASLLKDSVHQLALQGCRSVGLITNVVTPPAEAKKSVWSDFYLAFQRAVHAEGMMTRVCWMREPVTEITDPESHGYQEIKNLWSLPVKPDGLIVYPDVLARGAVMAILKLGIQVPQQLKCVFHRNSRVRFLCPFPATWAISDEAQMAAELIRMIQRQFNGEKVSPILVSHSFKSDPGVE